MAKIVIGEGLTLDQEVPQPVADYVASLRAELKAKDNHIQMLLDNPKVEVDAGAEDRVAYRIATNIYESSRALGLDHEATRDFVSRMFMRLSDGCKAAADRASADSLARMGTQPAPADVASSAGDAVAMPGGGV